MPLGNPYGYQLPPDLRKQGLARFLLQAGAPLLGLQASMDPGAAFGAAATRGMAAFDDFSQQANEIRRQRELDQLRQQQFDLAQRNFEADQSYRETILGQRAEDIQREQSTRDTAISTLQDMVSRYPEDNVMQEVSRLAQVDPSSALQRAYNRIDELDSQSRLNTTVDALEKSYGSHPAIAPLIPGVRAGIIDASAIPNMYAALTQVKKDTGLPVEEMMDDAVNLLKNFEVTNQEGVTSYEISVGESGITKKVSPTEAFEHAFDLTTARYLEYHNISIESLMKSIQKSLRIKKEQEEKARIEAEAQRQKQLQDQSSQTSRDYAAKYILGGRFNPSNRKHSQLVDTVKLRMGGL